MSDAMEPDEVVEAIADCLKGEGAALTETGFAIATLDIGELYVRTPDGVTYRLVPEAVSADDVAGWGIDFED